MVGRARLLDRNQRSVWAWLAASALLVFVVTACGKPLARVGETSQRFVYGDTSSTTAPLSQPGEVQAAPNLGAVSDLVWLNDEISEGQAEPVVVVARVWARGDGSNSFIQAGRDEIASALPGIRFPAVAPAGVTHVSSQLVYDVGSATIDVGTSAAFGFWTAVPYTVPRLEGQLAVLRVGQSDLGELDGTSVDGEIISFLVEGGREFAWASGTYGYELFCRDVVSEFACKAMAESMAPLAELLAAGGA
ncbi:MAG: hypothetical protein ACE5KX_04850 [Acidimicrobiia bacterium]